MADFSDDVFRDAQSYLNQITSLLYRIRQLTTVRRWPGARSEGSQMSEGVDALVNQISLERKSPFVAVEFRDVARAREAFELVRASEIVKQADLKIANSALVMPAGRQREISAFLRNAGFGHGDFGRVATASRDVLGRIGDEARAEGESRALEKLLPDEKRSSEYCVVPIDDESLLVAAELADRLKAEGLDASIMTSKAGAGLVLRVDDLDRARTALDMSIQEMNDRAQKGPAEQFQEAQRFEDVGNVRSDAQFLMHEVNAHDADPSTPYPDGYDKDSRDLPEDPEERKIFESERFDESEALGHHAEVAREAAGKAASPVVKSLPDPVR